MNTYRYVLSVEVEVDAFSEEDAEDAIEEMFGPGNDCGIEVKNLRIESL